MSADKIDKKYMTWQLIRKGNYYNGAVTDDMLKDLSETFGKNGDVPIGIGHVNYFFDDSRPAEGWIDTKKDYGIDKKGNFVTKGVSLFEPLKTMYEEGRYKNWSVVIARPRIYNEKKDAFDLGKWELRAVDLLGRATPAVKNLKDLTESNKTSELSKFTVDPDDENIIKFTESGTELEIMHFSLAGEIEMTDSNITDNKEEEKMNELEKQIESMKAEIEAQNASFAEIQKKNEEEIQRLTAERDKAAAKSTETMKKFTEIEEAKLQESTKSLPVELRNKLFSAIKKTLNSEMLFSEENGETTSIYGILSDCFTQCAFTQKTLSSNEMPAEFKTGDSTPHIYSDGRKLTKKMFSQK